jgi:DNA-directed RNA polymerase specialized sigma24 family protein
MDAELGQLRAALDTMSNEAHEVFVRCRFGDQDYTRIAAELDIDIAEVERRLAAAMLHMRQALYGEGG